MGDVETDTVSITGPIREVLVQLVLNGVAAPSLSLSAMKSGKWGEIGFDKYEGTLSLGASGSVTLRCSGSRGACADPCFDFRLEDQTLVSRFVLEDGSILDVDQTYLRQCGGLDFGSGTRPGVVMDLHGWRWNGHVIPAFWVGRMAGVKFENPNLFIQKGKFRFSNESIRMEGQSNWHFLRVKGESDYVVLIEPRNGMITRESIGSDLLAAEFCFGKPLALDYLVGVDSDLKPVTGMGLGFGGSQDTGRRCPVPDTLQSPDCWLPVLFGYLTRKMEREGLEKLLVAIRAYLYGMMLEIDLGYLSAQVGLESFANKIVQVTTPNTLVKSSADWEDWVNRNADEIKAHANDEKDAQKLLNKLRSSAPQAPTSDRVEAALKHFELEVPMDAIKEIRRRNRVAHMLFMSEADTQDVQVDADRRDVILSLLTALVAKHVGYRGPIAGWEYDRYGYQPCAEWWPHKGDDERLVQYLCVLSGEEGTVEGQ